MDEYIEIPYQQLSSDALQGLIEEFINREGTDYGEVESVLNDKVNQLMQSLRQGRAVIVFDPVIESCTLMAKN